MPLFNAIVRRELPKLGMIKLGLKKLETSFFRVVQSIFRYLDPLRRDSRVHEYERQRDRRTDRHCHNERWRAVLHYDARPKIHLVILIFR